MWSKVLFIVIGYFLLDSNFVFVKAETIDLKFAKDHSQCVFSAEKSESRNQRIDVNDEVTTYVGTTIRMSFSSNLHINKAECLHNDETSPSVYIPGGPIGTVTVLVTSKPAISSMAGLWICSMFTNIDNQDLPGAMCVNGSCYTRTNCVFRLKIEEFAPSANVSHQNATSLSGSSKISTHTWTFIGIAVVVAVVFATQTAVILYFKAKARRIARLGSLTQRIRNNADNDKKRYSTSPGHKGLKIPMFNRGRNSKDDNDIYETLEELRNNGESTPPAPPIETIPTLRTPLPTRTDPSAAPTLLRPADRARVPPQPSPVQRLPAGRDPPVDIRNRPPLPLPTDLYEEPQYQAETPKRAFPPSPTETAKDRTIPVQPQRMVPFALPPPKVGGPGGMNSLTKTRAGLVQAHINNELDSVLKMRKASLLPAPTPAKKPNRASKMMSLPPFRKKSTIPEPATSSNTYNPFANGKRPNIHLPPKPNPMPAGKSAVLLGLSPPPPRPVAPRPKLPSMPPKPPAVHKPAPPLPVEKPAPPPPPVVISKPPAPLLHPKALIQAPPLPAAAIAKPPILLPKAPIKEPEYEEYKENSEEQIYNSDEEWTYEPLSKYNIYSS